MKTTSILASILALTLGFQNVSAQGLHVSSTLVVSESPFVKGADIKSLQQRLHSANEQGPTIELFLADRGDRKGEYLLVRSGTTSSDNPLGNLTEYLEQPKAFTKYSLIGADKVGGLPTAGILGFHFIKVKKDKVAEFDRFVVSKLHPAVSNLLPDMRLLYFKATQEGKNGSYLLLFAITSTAARDKYWPEGTETQLLKDAFKPLKGLAQELIPYQEPGSYLEVESGGAAAIFESKEWTDFVLVE